MFHQLWEYSTNVETAQRERSRRSTAVCMLMGTTIMLIIAVVAQSLTRLGNHRHVCLSSTSTAINQLREPSQPCIRHSLTGDLLSLNCISCCVREQVYNCDNFDCYRLSCVFATCFLSCLFFYNKKSLFSVYLSERGARRVLTRRPSWSSGFMGILDMWYWEGDIALKVDAEHSKSAHTLDRSEILSLLRVEKCKCLNFTININLRKLSQFHHLEWICSFWFSGSIEPRDIDR